MDSTNNILRMLKEQDEGSLKNNLNSYDQLIKCTIDVTQSFHDAKIKLEEWEVYLESLIIKIIHAAKSIHTLAGGMTIESMKQDIKMEIIDRSSIFLLTRAIIESFLTLEYLYFNRETKDLQKFRYNLWRAAGLKTRQNVELTGPIPPHMSEDLQRQYRKMDKEKADEKKVLDQLLIEIKSSPYYQQLSKANKIKHESYGCPRTLTWGQLRKASIISTQKLNKMYSLCSNHAHSEYISAIQINELSPRVNNPDLIQGAIVGINTASIIISTVIMLLKDRFTCAKIIFNALPQTQYDEINEWYMIGKLKDQ